MPALPSCAAQPTSKYARDARERSRPERDDHERFIKVRIQPTSIPLGRTPKFSPVSGSSVFSDNSDQEVRDAWHNVLAHLGTDANSAGWQEKLNDLKVDLFREIGVRVGYKFTTDYLKRQIYLLLTMSMRRARYYKSVTR
jgi:hypothetical protein